MGLDDWLVKVVVVVVLMYVFIHGLCCCVQASHDTGFSCCGTWPLGMGTQ